MFSHILYSYQGRCKNFLLLMQINYIFQVIKFQTNRVQEAVGDDPFAFRLVSAACSNTVTMPGFLLLEHLQYMIRGICFCRWNDYGTRLHLCNSSLHGDLRCFTSFILLYPQFDPCKSSSWEVIFTEGKTEVPKEKRSGKYWPRTQPIIQ